MTVPAHDLQRVAEVISKAITTCSLQSAMVADTSTLSLDKLLSLSFDELGFDSLNFMEFCIALHLDLGLELSIGEVASLRTLGAVADRVLTRSPAR